MGPPGQSGAAPTSVALYDQGLLQVLEAGVTALAPRSSYVLGFRDTGGNFEPLASFATNPAGAAIVTATGQIRQIVTDDRVMKRWLEIVTQGPDLPARTVQVQRH